MNDQFTQTNLQHLMQIDTDNAVSLYMPANRITTETQKDAIRFKNLVNQAQETLMERGMRRPNAIKLLEPAADLIDDSNFWQNQSNGLALFLAPDMEPGIYRLPVRFAEICYISHRFYVKPLLRLFSHDGNYFVLALSQKDVRFFRGNRDGFAQQAVDGLPTNIQEALGEWQPQRELQYHTSTGRASDDGRQAAMFHGHAGSEVQMKDELLRFFRRIDDALHPHLRDQKAPLVLAAVDYLHPIFAEASRYPHLLEAGYDGSPEELSEQELHEATWPIVEPVFKERLAADQELFAQLAGTGRTGSYVDEVAVAAYQGRVETAFLAQGARVWGKFDPEMGKVIEQHESTESNAPPDQQPNNSSTMIEPGREDEDLLDFIALHTYLNGGTVHVPAPEEVPGKNAAAAIYRF